jgi:hypothetical protein
MNFKSIENYFKKNYKFIIIICLFLVLIMTEEKKFTPQEDFTPIQALDSVKSTEKKVNDIFSHIDANKATMKKQLHMNNNLSLEAKQIRLKNADDSNHVIFYNKGLDGVEMKGWKGVSLATGEGGAKRVVEIKKDYMKINNAKFCIGGTCINETDLKKIKSGRVIGGYAYNGDGTTYPLYTGGWHTLYDGNGTHNIWTNDRWDVVQLLRGWRGEFAEHGKGTGWVKKYENKDRDVRVFHELPDNRVSSYKLTWIGY